MCRWFAYISPSEPCLIADMLISPPHAITKQVSTHYLPYLTHHETVDNMVDDVVSSDPDKPSPHLAPPTKSAPSDEDKAAHEVKLRNLMLNVDGSGMAIYTPSASNFQHPSVDPPVLHPATFKSTQMLIHDDNFQSIAHNTETTCLLTHVRAEDGGAPVSTLNCHPFVFGRWAVMHNGSVGAFHDIRRKLLDSLSKDAFRAIKGGTDSEMMGALFVDALTNHAGKDSWNDAQGLKAMLQGIESVFAGITEAQRAVGVEEASSLNVCVTDGTKLVATRFRDHEGQQPPSLYWSDKAGRTLNRKFPGHPDPKVHDKLKKQKTDTTDREHGRHVIVASEPTTFVEKDWKLLEKNTAILVDENGYVDFVSLGPY